MEICNILKIKSDHGIHEGIIINIEEGERHTYYTGQLINTSGFNTFELITYKEKQDIDKFSGTIVWKNKRMTMAGEEINSSFIEDYEVIP